MKVSFQCAFGAAALLLSSSALAESYNTPAFGVKGQLAISAERLFGFVHDSATVSANNQDSTVKTDSISFLSSPIALAGGGATWGGYGTPRVAGDYFVIDHLSVGGALGYSHWSFSVPGAGNTSVSSSGDSFLFAPRVGYSYTFSDMIGIWPRAGFTYRSFSAGDNSGHDFAFTLEAPVIFTVIPHVAFWGGPTLDLGLSGSQSTKVGAVTQSFDFSATDIGLQTGLVAYLDL